MVVLWYGSQDPAVCRRLYETASSAAKTSGAGKVAAVSIVKNRTVGAPSPAARDALARLHEDPERVIHRSALVFARTGFVASIVRSIVLSLRQRASRRDGHDIFSTPEAALAWVTQDLPVARGTSVSTSALLSAIEQQDAQRLASVA
jgi:hypothetical protein